MAQQTEFTKKKEVEVKALPIEEKKRLIRDGKAYWFFPRHLVEQIIICMAIVMILVTFSTVFPPHLGPKANPFDTPEHIKPEWYFLAAYYSLKMAEHLDFLGSWAPKILGVAFQGLGILALILVPFIDRSGPERRPGKRPVAMAVGVIVSGMVIVFTLLGHFS